MKRHNMLLFVSSLAGFWIIIMSLLLIKASAQFTAVPKEMLIEIHMIAIASIALGFLMLIGGLLTSLHQYFAGGVMLIIASVACFVLGNNINFPGIVLGLIAGIDALLRKEEI